MRRIAIAAVVVVLSGLVGQVRADDKANPTGTWKWSVERNNQKIEMTLKLELKDGKLTGAMVGRDGKETAISDGEFKDGEVSFKVVRERNGQKFETSYSGKVSG